MGEKTCVLIETTDHRQREAWQAALRGNSLLVISEKPAHDDLDIHVVLQDGRQNPERTTVVTGLTDGMTGVIRVGGAAPADVLLPADARPRELKLACQLLGQLVKTRRKYVREQRRVRVLRELAHSDPLTGLANRRGWEEGCRRLEDMDEVAEHWAVAIIDLDEFKEVNNRFGFAVGDATLRAFAVRLNDCLPPHALLARLGGDEFVALVPLERAELAVDVVDQWRLRATVPSEAAILPRVTASAGVACVPRQRVGSVISRGIERADRALRTAKDQGRNCTVADASDLA